MHLGLKTLAARTLETTGALALAENLFRSRRRAVFALHRVLPREEMSECYNPYLAITPESFDHFLGWLRLRCSVVSLEELLSSPDSRAAACALTFDDGWEDNHRVAFPILQSHGVTAQVYLVTGLVGKQELFPEEQLWQMLRGASPEQRTHIAERLQATADSVGSALKRLPYARKLEILLELQKQFPELRPTRTVSKFMDWEQVASMRQAGHTFGSHTVHHTILPREANDTIARELSLSKQELDARLGEKTLHFAFPSGEFDARTVAAVEAAGYRTAVTTVVGTLSRDYRPLSIPRLPMDNTVVNDLGGKFSPSRARLLMARSMAGTTDAPDYMSPTQFPAVIPANPSDISHAPVRPLKVLLILDEMEAITSGGTERQVLQIGRLLVDSGFDVRFAVLRGTAWLDQADLPFPVQRFAVDQVKSLRGLRQLVALKQWMKRERFDVVQSFFVEANVVVPILARLAGVPVIIGSRRNLNYWMNPFWSRLQRFSNRFTTRLVANCEAVKLAVQRTEHVPASKVDVLYNGLDVEYFARNPESRRQMRAAYGYAESEIVIGAVSVLRPIKGCETFIDAAIEVNRQAPNARFVLVGDGPLRSDLEMRAATLGGTIRFAGSQEDVRPFLSMFDLGILSSESEGFSNSILEYMAAGLPTIVTNVGGNEEAVDNAGLVVDKQQPKQLANAILQLLRDPAQREILSQKAVSRAQAFNLPSTQASLVAFYHHLVTKS